MKYTVKTSELQEVSKKHEIKSEIHQIADTEPKGLMGKSKEA